MASTRGRTGSLNLLHFLLGVFLVPSFLSLELLPSANQVLLNSSSNYSVVSNLSVSLQVCSGACLSLQQVCSGACLSLQQVPVCLSAGVFRCLSVSATGVFRYLSVSAATCLSLQQVPVCLSAGVFRFLSISLQVCSGWSQVTWLLPAVPEGGVVQVEPLGSSSVLRLLNASWRDSGRYTCEEAGSPERRQVDVFIPGTGPEEWFVPRLSGVVQRSGLSRGSQVQRSGLSRGSQVQRSGLSRGSQVWLCYANPYSLTPLRSRGVVCPEALRCGPEEWFVPRLSGPEEWFVPRLSGPEEWFVPRLSGPEEWFVPRLSGVVMQVGLEDTVPCGVSDPRLNVSLFERHSRTPVTTATYEPGRGFTGKLNDTSYTCTATGGGAESQSQVYYVFSISLSRWRCTCLTTCLSLSPSAGGGVPVSPPVCLSVPQRVEVYLSHHLSVSQSLSRWRCTYLTTCLSPSPSAGGGVPVSPPVCLSVPQQVEVYLSHHLSVSQSLSRWRCTCLTTCLSLSPSAGGGVPVSPPVCLSVPQQVEVYLSHHLSVSQSLSRWRCTCLTTCLSLSPSAGGGVPVSPPVCLPVPQQVEVYLSHHLSVSQSLSRWRCTCLTTCLSLSPSAGGGVPVSPPVCLSVPQQVEVYLSVSRSVLKVGESLMVNCTVRDVDMVFFTWDFPRRQEVEPMTDFLPNHIRSFVNISAATVEDSGETHLSALLHHTVTLSVEADAHPPPTVLWTKDNNTVATETSAVNTTHLTGSRYLSTLTLVGVRLHQTGSYTASVSNEDEAEEVVFNLEVKAPPRITSLSEVGSQEMLCAAEGAPPPNITWYTCHSSHRCSNATSGWRSQSAASEDNVTKDIGITTDLTVLQYFLFGDKPRYEARWKLMESVSPDGPQNILDPHSWEIPRDNVVLVLGNTLYLSLYLSTCLSTCLPVSLPVSLPVYLSLYLSTCLSTCLPVSLPVYLSLYLSTCLTTCLTTCLPVSLPLYLSLYLSTCLSTCLPVSLPVYLSLYLSLYLSTCQVLGSGAFGRVVEASVSDLIHSHSNTKVAVKMVKQRSGVQSLVSELKVLVHIGPHLNLVNLLGACTRGDLVNYLQRNKHTFLQSDTHTKSDGGYMDMTSETQYVAMKELSPAHIQPAEYEELCTPAGQQEGPPPLSDAPPLSLMDLLSFSFQIAQAMDFLSSRNTPGGDFRAGTPGGDSGWGTPGGDFRAGTSGRGLRVGDSGRGPPGGGLRGPLKDWKRCPSEDPPHECVSSSVSVSVSPPHECVSSSVSVCVCVLLTECVCVLLSECVSSSVSVECVSSSVSVCPPHECVSSSVSVCVCVLLTECVCVLLSECVSSSVSVECVSSSLSVCPPHECVSSSLSVCPPQLVCECVSSSLSVCPPHECVSSSLSVVHRDLAARNVLVCEGKLLKVCDLSLARDLMKDKDYTARGIRFLPVRWMSPESLFQNLFSCQSDVWSYGVLLWELFSLGASPYPELPRTQDFCSSLKTGNRMTRPEHAPLHMYDLMKVCWAESPQSRPSFSSLVVSVGNLLTEDYRKRYLQLTEDFLSSPAVLRSRRSSPGADGGSPDAQVLEAGPEEAGSSQTTYFIPITDVTIETRGGAAQDAASPQLSQSQDTQKWTSPEDRQEGTSPEDRQEGTSPEDRQEGTSPEDRQEGTSPEDRQEGTSPEDRQKGTSPEEEESSL
ncbi:hypothetical protein JOQ06_000089 [Pogonophryne albipinna]|uniref:receptor protein-tyrosine kinase n=1 Tax=Pogonophryne albipinna TaxID=1090488 RepID=A0AAD6A6L9_9TELE|nr:hypothetical protein JOQ06_000089 [Pogonophryne albipinna]